MFRYYRCAVCGKRGLDTSPSKNRRFCSKECSNTYFSKKRVTSDACTFNEGVVCDKHKCRKCGWNPAVAKMRVEALV